MKASASEKPEEVLSHPALSSGVKTYLVIHQGAIGDFVLALPTLENLRKAFPGAEATFLGYPGVLELADKRFFADEILSINRKEMAPLFAEGGELEPSLRKFFGRFDLLLVFAKDANGILIRNLERVCPGRVLHISSFPSRDDRVHLTEHYLKELSRHGVAVSSRIPKIRLNDADRRRGRDFWNSRGLSGQERERVVILHPGSGSRKKAWPVGRFLDLARVLQKEIGSRILVVMGPAEPPDLRRLFGSLDRGDRGVAFAEGLSLLHLAAVMEGCRLFVGNDSGISHLAAALGIPTVAVFGPTDPAVWAPRGERVAVVGSRILCSPCSQERFAPCQNVRCLEAVATRDVLEAIEQLMHHARRAPLPVTGRNHENG